MFANYFETLGLRFIPGGDYNAKHLLWESRLSTTRDEKKMKERLMNRWQLTKNAADKTNFNRAIRELKKLIGDYKNESIQQSL